MKKIFFNLALIALSLLMMNCIDTNRPRNAEIDIIVTTDVHGAIFPFNAVENRETNSSLAQVQAYVQEKRLKGQDVILLDNGDILQGQPVVYYYNYEKIDVPHILPQVLNYMQYDAATVGNHDIECGHDVYDRVKKELNCAYLAANAIDTKTKEPYFEPYKIVERNGVKVAVLGLITPSIPNWLPEELWKGIEFEDMIISAKKWVKIIQEKENPDLLVGLFHSGMDFTYNNQNAETPNNENAVLLVADQVAGFDVIFGGHDHKHEQKTITNKAGKKVLIIDAGSYARSIGLAKIRFTMQTDNTYKKDITGSIIDMTRCERDPDFMRKFGKKNDEIKKYVSTPIAVFDKRITVQNAFFGNSAFIDLIHDFQKDISGAKISFAAPLSFNSQIKEGQIYTRDMFKLYRYENMLYTMELTGQEIKDFLEFSYAGWFNTMKNENDYLLNFSRDSSGRFITTGYSNNYKLATAFYNFSSASGINYTVDVRKPVGERIAISSLEDGNTFDLDKKYKVALNSYRGCGGGNHLTLGSKIKKEDLADRVLKSTNKDLRYYLMKWLEKKQRVSPKAHSNWQIIPKEWAEKAKKREAKLLFGNSANL